MMASCVIHSDDVNDYLREIAGPDVSAKDFRTWAGTVLAVLALSAIGPFKNKTQSKMYLRRAFEAVGTKLGNTPTICRTCYVHPEVVTCYLEGALPTVLTNEREGNRKSGLPKEEHSILRLLERRLASSGRRVAEPRSCPC